MRIKMLILNLAISKIDIAIARSMQLCCFLSGREEQRISTNAVRQGRELTHPVNRIPSTERNGH